MRKILLTGLFAVIVLSTSSCATIFTGTKDPITFNSTPEGAKVVMKGVDKCVTPCTLEVPRALGKQMVEIKKDGYATQEFKLTKDFNAVSLVNIIFGGVIGFGIDLATGSFVKYNQKTYSTSLEVTH